MAEQATSHYMKPLYETIIIMTSQRARRRLKSPASPLFTQPFIRAQIKQTIKAPRHCAGNSPITVEFPAQMASNAENVSIGWRHDDDDFCQLLLGTHCSKICFKIQIVWLNKSHKNGPRTRYVKLWAAHAPEMTGTFSPPPTSKGTAS